jgi:predicted Zn-dependent peptidase
MRGGLVLSMDDPGGRMSRLGRSELVHGEVLTVDDLLARVEAVTREDVSRVAQRVFTGPAVLSTIGPVPEGDLDFAVDALGH